MLYGDRQRIWDQAENRRHAQKALLELLVGVASPSVADPRDVVVITRARLQEVVDEAVAPRPAHARRRRRPLADLLAVPRDLARRVDGEPAPDRRATTT